jgi:hypothetical protein
MCRFRSLAAFLLLFVATPLRAETPSPLRLIPDQADFVVQIEQPRKLVEAFTTFELVNELQKLDSVRELYDSTNYRRFFQFVAYFEKELGKPWPELLDQLGGGGIAVAGKFGDNSPAVLVVQCKDEALLKKAFKRAVEIAEQELARVDDKAKLGRGDHEGVQIVHLADKLYAAVVGSALVVSNKDKGMQAAIERHVNGGKQSLAGMKAIPEARKLLPPDPLAWLWINMETVHQAPQAKELFKMPRNDAQLTVLAGGVLDVAGRSPFVCAGFHRDGNGFLATIRAPVGRDGMSAGLAYAVPPKDKSGTLPLLEPKGVVFSNSFYMDLSELWEQRGKLFNEQTAKAMSEFDKKSGAILAGNKLSQIFNQLGAHYRLVATHQMNYPYSVNLSSSLARAIPAFALVIEMRDTEEGRRNIETAARLAAFAATTQVKMKMTEANYGARTIVTYRFPEDQKLAGDTDGIRFRFSPSFVAVGNQFVVSSTLELARELVDLLENEAKTGSAAPSAVSNRSQLYAKGGTEILKGLDDFLLTQTILGQALPPDVARREVDKLVVLLGKLGVFKSEQVYGAKESHIDLRLQVGK